MNRSSAAPRRRTVALLTVGGLLLSTLALLAPTNAEAVDLATVRTVVRVVTVDPVTHQRIVTPFPDVEVWLGSSAGSQWGCTNANGIIVFRDLPPADDYIVATGVSFNIPRCPNADFLHPVSGDKLFTVAWDRSYGTGVADKFQIVAGANVVRLLAARPAPKNQRRVCTGFRVTQILTPGDDDWTGTDDMDVVNGLGGDDVILGGGNRDIICGGPGADSIEGQDGPDILNGESGPDDLVGGASHDVLLGGPGFDACGGEQLVDCEIWPEG